MGLLGIFGIGKKKVEQKPVLPAVTVIFDLEKLQKLKLAVDNLASSPNPNEQQFKRDYDIVSERLRVFFMIYNLSVDEITKIVLHPEMVDITQNEANHLKDLLLTIFHTASNKPKPANITFDNYKEISIILNNTTFGSTEILNKVITSLHKK